MLKIGFTRLGDSAGADVAALRASGCHVVRTADRQADALRAILEFIGPGDELIVARLDRLAGSARELLEVLDRLDDRGASLRVLEPALSSEGLAGPALRAVLGAVAMLDTGSDVRSRRPAVADTHAILALQRTGVGPVEIARRLGVSRMTVWRKLKAVTG